MILRYSLLESPVGTVLVARTSKGICRVSIGGNEKSFRSYLKENYNSDPIRDDNGLRLDVEALRTYFQKGTPVDHRQIDFLEGTSFQHQVWEAMRRIPQGEVRTYGWIARAIKNPKASRAVGQACGSNPIGIVVPCHRVIASGNHLGGFGGDTKTKRKLLSLEGIDVSKLK